MYLALATLLLSTRIIGCQAYLPSSQYGGRRLSTFVRSSSTSNDAAFSAFADSLDQEPEEHDEKPWQAKVEDLLDPKTNLADVRPTNISN
jgi:hypothetical protein